MRIKELAGTFYNQVIFPEIRKLGFYFDKTPFKPSRIVIVISENCNLRCKQCHTWMKKHSEKPLTEKEYKQLLLQIRNWLGRATVSFGGGEPFLNKNLFNLLEFANKMGFHVNMTTNATLISKSDAKRISKFKFLDLNISLDGIKPETHDYLRGVPGTYKHAMEVIDSLDKDYLNQRVTLSTTIMYYNIDEIIPLVKFVHEKGMAMIGFQNLAPTFSEPYYENWYKDNVLFPRTRKEKEKVLKVLDQLIAMKKRGDKITNSIIQLRRMKKYFLNPSFRLRKRCYLGVDNFVVDGFGKVRMCFTRPHLDNIRNHAPEQIWNSSITLKERRFIRNCKRPCSMLFCTYTPGLLENTSQWYYFNFRYGFLEWKMKIANKMAKAFSFKIRKTKSKQIQAKPIVLRKEPGFITKLQKRHEVDIARFEKFLNKKHPDLVERYSLFCKLIGTYFGKRALIATHYRKLGGCVY